MWANFHWNILCFLLEIILVIIFGFNSFLFCNFSCWLLNIYRLLLSSLFIQKFLWFLLSKWFFFFFFWNLLDFFFYFLYFLYYLLLLLCLILEFRRLLNFRILFFWALHWWLFKTLFRFLWCDSCLFLLLHLLLLLLLLLRLLKLLLWFILADGARSCLFKRTSSWLVKRFHGAFAGLSTLSWKRRFFNASWFCWWIACKVAWKVLLVSLVIY